MDIQEEESEWNQHVYKCICVGASPCDQELIFFQNFSWVEKSTFIHLYAREDSYPFPTPVSLLKPIVWKGTAAPEPMAWGEFEGRDCRCHTPWLAETVHGTCQDAGFAMPHGQAFHFDWKGLFFPTYIWWSIRYNKPPGFAACLELQKEKKWAINTQNMSVFKVVHNRCHRPATTDSTQQWDG